MKVAAFLAALGAGMAAAQDFAGIPQCAISCLTDAIPKVGCGLSDTACQCDPVKQQALVGQVAPCLTTACSPADLQQALTASNAICAALASSKVSSAVASATSAIGIPSTTAAVTTTAAPAATTTAAAGGSANAMGGGGIQAAVAAVLAGAVGVAAFL